MTAFATPEDPQVPSEQEVPAAANWVPCPTGAQNDGTAGSRRRRLGGLVVVALLGVVAALLVRYLLSSDRRNSLKLTGEFVAVLDRGSAEQLLQMVRVPEAAADKSPSEQAQWLRDVLREEITPAGVAALGSKGRFGPLPEIFPDQASAWTEGSGLRPADCFAWRMERGGITAELVYSSSPQGTRFLRINNIAQMADPNLK